MSYQESTTVDEGEQQESIELPTRIINRVQERLQRTEFETTTEYITFVLEEVLNSVEIKEKGKTTVHVDESEIESRLQSLGYLSE